MGILSSAWGYVKSAGKTVYSLAEKAYKYCTGNNASTAYDELKERLDRNNNSSGSNIESRHGNVGSIFGNQEYISKDESDSKQNQLMFEYNRLRSSAELIDRVTKHIKIHASNLSVHYESIKNITSLIEQGKRTNRILEQIISVTNKNADTNGEDFHKIVIESSDVEVEDISQLAALDAFDRTRELLKDEIIELSDISTSHLKGLDIFKMKWVKLGGEPDDEVINFINEKIIPIIKNAEIAGMMLKEDVLKLPVAPRQEDGKIQNLS